MWAYPLTLTNQLSIIGSTTTLYTTIIDLNVPLTYYCYLHYSTWVPKKKCVYIGSTVTSTILLWPIIQAMSGPQRMEINHSFLCEIKIIINSSHVTMNVTRPIAMWCFMSTNQMAAVYCVGLFVCRRGGTACVRSLRLRVYRYGVA